MQKVDGFLNKFLKRFDKIDADSLKNYVLNLNREKEFLYTVLDSLPYGLLLIDCTDTITFFNRYAKQTLMRSDSERSVPCEEIFKDPDLYSIIMEKVDSHLTFDDVVVDLMHPTVKKLIVNGYPLFDDNDVMYMYVVTLKEEQSDESIEELHRNEKINSLKTLAAGLAHEIGNPLNTIKIYLKLITAELKGCSSQKIENFISVISDETDRLDKLIKNFLSVTRSRVSLRKKRHIHEPLTQAINFFKAQFEQAKIAIELELSEDIPSFYLDSDRLYEAFVNLLKNALEAMPAGGTLTVKTTIKDAIVNVLVQDSGIGIDEDALPYIFDAYYTSKEEGSGLGLMNVYNIIKAHKGRIHVASSHDAGTRIILSLPLKKDKLQLPFFTHTSKGEMHEH